MAESFDNVRISKFQNPFAGDKMMFDDGAAALSFSIKKRAWLHGKFFIIFYIQGLFCKFLLKWFYN